MTNAPRVLDHLPETNFISVNDLTRSPPPGSPPAGVGAARKAVRNDLMNDAALVESLRKAVSSGAMLVPSVGNVGDGLIQLGTFDLLASLDISLPTMVGLDRELLGTADALVVGGGGGWVEGLYDTWVWALTPFLEKGGQLVILPSSISGYQEFFARFGAQITLFARERETVEQMEDIAEMRGRVHLAHDLAFGIKPDRFALHSLHPGDGVGFMMRTDKESRQAEVRFGNLDLALARNGVQWTSPETCLAAVDRVAHLMTLYSTIVSDRLHMSALAALTGRRVEMVGNSYHKNRGVYAHTLSRFPNVRFFETWEPLSDV